MQAAGAPPAWHRTGAAAFLSVFTLGTVAFFVAIQISGQHDGPLNNLTEGVIFLSYVSALLLTLRRLRLGLGTTAGPLRSFAIAVCIALILAAGAALTWEIYNLRGVEVPYPSLVDVFYVASDITWAVSLCFIFWALETNLRDELGPFIDTLGVAWSLIIVGLTLLGLTADAVGSLPKLMLDIVYPALDALICALLAAILFGAQFRRLSIGWRWCIILLYCSWLLTFLADVGFGITTAFSLRHLPVGGVYYDGGPIDAVYDAGNLLVCWAVAFLPLGATLSINPEPPSRRRRAFRRRSRRTHARAGARRTPSNV